MQANHEPPPPQWPADDTLWSREFDLEYLTTCICIDGWLPEPQGETMLACHVCNVVVEV